MVCLLEIVCVLCGGECELRLGQGPMGRGDSILFYCVIGDVYVAPSCCGSMVVSVGWHVLFSQCTVVWGVVVWVALGVLWGVCVCHV